MAEIEAKLLDDPWTLDQRERRVAFVRHASAQQRWLPRLRRLVEPPAPDDEFPAFLLSLPQFVRLERMVATAARADELDVGTADELQHFVDHYRGWLAATDLQAPPELDEPVASSAAGTCATRW